MHNVMVHIPNKLPGVTIKPATKHKINPVSIAKGKIGKSVTVTKLPNSGSNKLSNPFARKIAQNGNLVGRKPAVRSEPQSVVHPAMKILPALKNLQQIQALPPGKAPIKIVKLVNAGPQAQNRLVPCPLPPGITVKRTSQLQSVLKRNIKVNPMNTGKTKVNRPASKKVPGEMVCVDLDDDDTEPNSVGPQWYMRPEEQEKKEVKLTESPKKPTDLVKPIEETTNEMVSTKERKEATDLEKINNKEPDTLNYIEITIEDSPAKPQPKRTCEVADLAITIDDSPVKAASEKPDPSGSDEETTITKEKHSKKKLEYPKADTELKTLEIEIELHPVENASTQNDAKTQDGVTAMEVVEIVESPLKSVESFQTSTPKKKALPKPQTMKMNDINENVPKSKSKQNKNRPENAPKPESPPKRVKTVPPTTPGEFHPIYQSFIDLCFQLENSEDMSKIVEKKIKEYYRKAPKEYTESEMFIDMVSSKVTAMKESSEKMYLYIKDIVDELKLQKKIAKSEPPKSVTVNEGRSLKNLK